MTLAGSGQAVTAADADDEVRQRLELALQGGQIGIWDWDLTTGRISYSDIWAGMLGYEVRELAPDFSTWERLLHPDDTEGTKKKVEDYLSGRIDEYRLEFRLRHKCGEWRWILATGRVFARNEIGEPTRFSGTHVDISALKSATERYQESEERYELAVRGSTVGLWDWNIRTNELYWSPRFKEIVGITDEQFVPHFSEFEGRLHPEDHQRVIDAVAVGHLKNREPYDIEYRLRHVDGHYVWIHAKGQAIWDDVGNAVRMAGSVDDITGKRHAELSLTSMGRILEGSLNEIYFFDAVSLRFIEVNRGARENLGYSIDELQQLTPVDIKPHFTREQFLELIRSLAENTVESLDFETKHQRRDGSVYDVEVNLQKAFYVGRDVFVASVKDVSARKKAERALKDAGEFQQLVLNSNPDFIFVKDRAFRIVVANNAFLSAYPESRRDRIIGYTTVESYNEAEAAEFLKMDRLAFDEGESETLETIVFPDGVTRTLLTRKIRFENSAGEEFILGCARDVTEREQLIRKLQRSNEELDEFAHIASHDLREPLRGIASHARFLDEDFGDRITEDERRRLRRIEDLSGFAENLVRDLLYYSRLGRAEKALQRTDLNALLRDTLSSMAVADDPGVSISVDGMLPSVVCDRVRLGEVFRNLIENGIKYNDSLKRTVRISAQPKRLEGHSAWAIRVCDNGIGIPDEFHSEIFRIFRRLHKRGDYGGGTGSGLTFVKKIIERHGGNVEVSSPETGGTCFIVTLPEEPVPAE